MTLKVWQIAVLLSPLGVGLGALLVVAGWQLHRWGLDWIWGGVTVGLLGWRWLLVRWTRPSQTTAPLLPDPEEPLAPTPIDPATAQRIEAAVQDTLQAARADPPLWEDWACFWQRCQAIVTAVAQVYYPDVKYPLLNIYVPQAYALMRGTVDSLDTWMRQMAPVLNRVTVGQAVETYEQYRRLAPAAQRVWQVWNWAQWLINPSAAAARLLSQRSSRQASQQLLGNLDQLLREAALRNLCQQAVALYGGETLELPAPETASPTPPKAQTQTLQAILDQAEPADAIAQQPLSLLLVGRTGAGKSSLINTLFATDRAAVDVLPSTEQAHSYRWQTDTGEPLILWDTPGYEQVAAGALRETVRATAAKADLLLLLTPALDPALQMDVDMLQQLEQGAAELPAIALVTQVDKLRPLREWAPPYDWQHGDRPKEQAIRAAVEYRQAQLGDRCHQVLPVVTAPQSPWNTEALVDTLLSLLEPTKQLRLSRCLRSRDLRVQAAARIIDRYTRQMATTQGLTALLKSPVLRFISTLATGSPGLAYVLAEQIPVERLPVVIGKLQLTYELFQLLSANSNQEDALRRLDWLGLWPLLTRNAAPPEQQAWALGHALVAYWTQPLTLEQLQQQYERYLAECSPGNGAHNAPPED